MIAPTLEEARFVTGLDSEMENLEELHKRGPKVVALTRDADGAVLSDGKRIVSVPEQASMQWTRREQVIHLHPCWSTVFRRLGS